MKLIKMAYLVPTLLAAPVFAQPNSNYTYLALGDSIPFGMNATLVLPYSTVAPKPSEFIGYPEALAAANGLLQSNKEVNASCPGETSASFLDTSEPDNGCNFPHLQPPAPQVPPFKTTYGLHTKYTEAQMAFALTQLQTNKHINLVTLQIGANDILLALPALEACGTDTACQTSVLTPVLSVYAGNLGQILAGIRLNGQYEGTLILVTYYSPLTALNSVTQALNTTMTQVATQFALETNTPSILIADGYDAFQLASALSNHDACQAGLLIRLPAGQYTATPCDIHPSPIGRDLLAAVVELAIWTRH